LVFRVVRGASWTIAWLLALGCAAWAFALALLAAIVFMRGAWRKLEPASPNFVIAENDVLLATASSKEALAQAGTILEWDPNNRDEDVAYYLARLDKRALLFIRRPVGATSSAGQPCNMTAAF
jgi:hypothetical protein